MIQIIFFTLFYAITNSLYQQPPYAPWAHKHWVWLNGGQQTQAKLLQMVNQYKKRSIPVGAVNIDNAWTTKYNNFQWDKIKFPDPQKMIDSFHAQNIKVILWVTSIINNDSNTFQQAKNKGYLLNNGQTISWWLGNGAFLDYSNQQAKLWWHSQMDRLLDMGVDGWKCDGTDPLLLFLRPWPYSGKKNKLITYRYYADQYYGDFFNYTKQKNKNTLIMSRPVDNLINSYYFSYSPKYVMFSGWVGDQDSSYKGFKDALVNLFHSAWKGYLNFGFDVGGYRGGNITNLGFLRYTQVGCMLPLMQNGGNGKHLPWLYNQFTASIYKIFAILHQDLLPFFLTAGTQAYKKGVSVMKPLAKKEFRINLEYPDTFEYILWNDILVSPILNDEGIATINFPASSDWVYYFNKTKIFKGNSSVDLLFPINQSAFFIRKGSMIPTKNKYLFFYMNNSNFSRTIYQQEFNDHVTYKLNNDELTLEIHRFYKETSNIVESNVIEINLIGIKSYEIKSAECIIQLSQNKESINLTLKINQRLCLSQISFKS